MTRVLQPQRDTDREKCREGGREGGMERERERERERWRYKENMKKYNVSKKSAQDARYHDAGNSHTHIAEKARYHHAVDVQKRDAFIQRPKRYTSLCLQTFATDLDVMTCLISKQCHDMLDFKTKSLSSGPYSVIERHSSKQQHRCVVSTLV